MLQKTMHKTKTKRTLRQHQDKCSTIDLQHLTSRRKQQRSTIDLQHLTSRRKQQRRLMKKEASEEDHKHCQHKSKINCCEETIEEKASRNNLRFSVNKLLLLLIKVLVMSPFLFASVHRAFKIHLSNRNSASKDPEYIGNF